MKPIGYDGYANIVNDSPVFIPIIPNLFINVSIDSINLYLSIEYT